MTQHHPRSGPSRAHGAPHSTPAQVTLAQAMAQAWSWYHTGDWVRADRAARLVLKARAEDFEALSLLGVLAARSGRTQEAADFLARAVAARPGDAPARNNHGNVLRDLGRSHDALRSYEYAIALNPLFAEAHYNRGVTLQSLGKQTAALDSYDSALRINPEHVAAYNNRGVVLRELKRLDEALAAHERAVAIRPDHASAWNNRGVILQETGRRAEALESYERALQALPDFPDALHNRGNVLRELDRNVEALESIDRAIALAPRHAPAHNSRGIVMQALHRPQAALESFERAAALQPEYAEAHYNIGNGLQALHRPEAALEHYERALELKPHYPEAFARRGGVLHELKRFEEALDSYAKALTLNADLAWLPGIWLHGKTRLCDWSGMEGAIARLRARIDADEKVTPPFVTLALIDDPALQHRAARLWARETAPPRFDLPPLPAGSDTGRIRLGYYSADFYHHATSALAAGLFEQHDRNRFELIGFDFGPHRRDEMSARLERAFERFIDVRDRSDIEVAKLSRELGVDIAVDLKGFTQHERAGIFAHRAARIQVSYLGYPGTMGAPYMDYLIADQVLIPPAARAHYTEKIVYLPHSYQVNDRSRQISPTLPERPLLGLPSDQLVLCSFNNAYKITPAMFDTWLRILQRVPRSVLWLLEESGVASRYLRERATSRGIDAERLVFAPRVPLPEHLARHRAADLFLDTSPCNAHTTASDALWAGLPVVTCIGESFAARVCASLLRAIGLPDLITTTLAEYEELAVRLAVDGTELASVTARLHANRLTHPLFDTERFTRNLESAYTQMIERDRSGTAGDHLFVAD